MPSSIFLMYEAERQKLEGKNTQLSNSTHLYMTICINRTTMLLIAIPESSSIVTPNIPSIEVELVIGNRSLASVDVVLIKEGLCAPLDDMLYPTPQETCSILPE